MGLFHEMTFWIVSFVTFSVTKRSTVSKCMMTGELEMILVGVGSIFADDLFKT
jgi:hypothetical protein